MMIEKEASDQKLCIYAELVAYRKKNGIGCFRALSEATGGKVAVGTIAHMYTGTKVNMDIWLLIGEALRKIK